MKKKKTNRAYRLCYWKDYNATLCQLGSFTHWGSDQILRLWLNQEQIGKRGSSTTYSDITSYG